MRHTLLSILLLGGCAGDASRDERAWQDADGLAAAGLSLAPLIAGEALAPSVRIAIRPDAVLVDSRTEWLSWSDAARRERRELREALAVDPEALVSLVDGRVPEAQRRGQLITPLFERLDALVATRIATDPADAPFDGRVQVWADASVPAETVRQVLYTAGQAQFSAMVLAGRVEGSVRGAHASRGGPWPGQPCAAHLLAHPSEDAQVLVGDGVAIAAPEARLGEVLADVVSACRPRWEAAHAAAPGGAEIPLERFGCVAVSPHLGDEAPIARALAVYAAAYPLWPDVVTAFPVGGAGPTPEARTLDALDPDALAALCGEVPLTGLIEAARHDGDLLRPYVRRLGPPTPPSPEARRALLDALGPHPLAPETP